MEVGEGGREAGREGGREGGREREVVPGKLFAVWLYNWLVQGQLF